MTFNSNVLGTWLFQQTLADEARANDFESPGGYEATYNNYTRFNLLAGKKETRYGLLLQDGITYTAGNEYDFVDGSSHYNLSIGFWYYSPEPVGYTRHYVTTKKTSYICPIIAKANSQVNSLVESVTAGEWIISEVAVSETQNAIQLALCSGGTNPSNIYLSDAYEPGLHHVFVTYKTTSGAGYASVQIDGKGTTFVAPYGASTVPATIGDLTINNIGFGYISHRKTQENAHISDLIVRSYASTTSNDAVRMMQFGWEYLANESLFDSKFNFLGVGYDQPATVTATTILPNGGNILVSQSDGTVLEGIRPLWDVEHVFNSSRIIPLLKPKDEKKVSIVEDNLTVSGTSIIIP